MPAVGNLRLDTASSRRIERVTAHDKIVEHMNKG